MKPLNKSATGPWDSKCAYHGAISTTCHSCLTDDSYKLNTTWS